MGDRLNHVRDDASDLVIYDLEKNLVYTDPGIATPDFENLPTWSPDGKYLYFIKTRHENKYLPDTVELYDLLRVPVNTKEQSIGTPELLISSDSVQKSISWPQVSPNGKFLVFCMTDYGYFTINDPTSNLYLMNLEDLSYNELPVNSNMTESFPSWSGNGRWLMFTSKRLDGRFTSPCFSYIDSSGIAQKPFVIPMKDPREYLTRLTNINRPVFVAGKIDFTQNDLLDVIYSEKSNVIFDSLCVDIDAIAGATVELENVITPQTGTPYMKD
jgi:Tol biopolymer transport system component